jgi:NarL family two-component system response regulator LiaR
MSLKVAFVEDNPVFYHTLKVKLGKNERVELVGAFSTAEGLLSELNYIMPNLILMDLDLPKISGIEAIIKIKEIDARIRVIVLTVFDDEETIFDSLKAGADGYLLKKDSANFIDEKILFIDKNEAAISPSIALKVINYFRNKKQNVLEINELNDRELQVLEFIAKGCLNKEIADKLFLSIDSIKKIAQNIYQKLYVRNRSEAIKKYLDSL